MKILICNVGSTSLKYRLFELGQGEEELAWGRFERVGAPMGTYSCGAANGRDERCELPVAGYAEGIERMLAHLSGCGALGALAELECVGFKVVHAKGVSGVQRLNGRVLSAMEAFNCVAPSHNPPYLAAISQFEKLLPGVPLVGAFETGFHQTLPPEAYLYAIPVEIARSCGIRRYGFHGASHEYVSGKVMEYLGTRDCRIITCHLGGSGSLCAVANGRSVDTDLGFSLQCGLPHNNRCGDLDPYILIYLMEEAGYSLDEVKTMLNRRSGMLGMSGISNDLRDIERAAQAGNADAANAIKAYCYAVKKRIGAYSAAMGGLDAVAFSGGIGENSASVRGKCLDGLEFLGIRPDAHKNKDCRCDSEISQSGSPVKIYVIATNEELVVARKAYAYLSKTGKNDGD